MIKSNSEKLIKSNLERRNSEFSALGAKKAGPIQRSKSRIAVPAFGGESPSSSPNNHAIDFKPPSSPSETNQFTFTSSMAPFSSGKASLAAQTANILVVCRFRPLNSKELAISSSQCIEFLDKSSVKFKPSQDSKESQQQQESGGLPFSQKTASEQLYTLDRIFKPDATQQEVYDVSARPVIESVLEGFNGTVFAHGQTSSGKTYTMQGSDIYDKKYRGIIPRMVETVFEKISQKSDNIEYVVKVSLIEIYLEKIRDLLDPKKTNLKIREEKKKGIYIEGCTEKFVNDEKDVYNLMNLGNNNRSIGVTNMNEQSSRSHSIFILSVQQNNIADFSSKNGKLYLVDLAGKNKKF